MKLHSRSNLPDPVSITCNTNSVRGIVNLQVPTKCISKFLTKSDNPNDRALSQGTRSSVMLRNLQLGLEYTEVQYSTLSKIDKLFALMTDEGCFTNDKTTSKNFAQNIVYTDTLKTLTTKRFSHIPLFGIGDESPIRIHLNLNRKRETYTLHPVPLLRAPGFSSFMKSGLTQRTPEPQFVELILEEILSFMISSEASSKEISALIDKVTCNSERINQLRGANLIASPKSGQSFFTKLIRTFSFG